MTDNKDIKITVSKDAEKDVLDLYKEELERMRKEIIKQVEHKHQINLQCAREASRLDTLEEVFKKFDEYACIKNDKWYLEWKEEVYNWKKELLNWRKKNNEKM